MDAFCASGSSSIDKSISDFKRWYLTLNIVGGKWLNSATQKDTEAFCNR